MASQNDQMTRDLCEASLCVSDGGNAMTASIRTSGQLSEDRLAIMRHVKLGLSGANNFLGEVGADPNCF